MTTSNSLVLQFLAETRDNLDDAARGLLTLEGASGNQEVINSIFRSFHTIKGTSGIFPEFQAITTLTHAAEELMDEIRNGKMQLVTEHVDLFLNALDLVGTWLEEIEANGAVPAGALSVGAPLREKFLACLNRPPEPVQATVPLSAGDDGATESVRLLREWLAGLPDQFRQECRRQLSEGAELFALRYAPDENCFFFGDDPANLLRQLSEIRMLEMTPASFPESPEEYDPFICTLTFQAVAADKKEAIASIFAYVEDQLCILPLLSEHFEAPAVPTRELHLDLTSDTSALEAPVVAVEQGVKKSTATSVLRIEQGLINRFVDLVGEMIIAKNALPYLSRRASVHYKVPRLAEEIETNYGTINQIVENFQDIALEMRMLPVSKAFERFPRLVRDISAKLNKKITLIMEGEETKADKDVIEALSEPMVHMVRNSLDHGIETPEERIAAGKSPEGTIRLSAFQDSTGIVVEIVDDGRGIDPEKIRRKAADKGISTAEALAVMPDEDVIQLVMAPNFSTAEVISDLSGRGVGMDVVNSMVKGFGGTVRIFSQLGRGSRVRMSLPLSMAIAKILIVKHGECTFGIPSSDVVETLIDIPKSRVSTVRTAPGLEVRGDLLPLYHLSKQLAMTDQPLLLKGFSAVVVKVRGETVALVVDSFCDIIDVVIKPLEGMMSDIRYYSGSTILGDGTIMFLLDLPEVIAYAD